MLIHTLTRLCSVVKAMGIVLDLSPFLQRAKVAAFLVLGSLFSLWSYSSLSMTLLICTALCLMLALRQLFTRDAMVDARLVTILLDYTRGLKVAVALKEEEGASEENCFDFALFRFRCL